MMSNIKKWFETWKLEVVAIPMALVAFVLSLFIPGAYPPGLIQKFFVAVPLFLGIAAVVWIWIRHCFKDPLWDYTEKDDDPLTPSFADDFRSCNQYQRLKIWLIIFFGAMFILTMLTKTSFGSGINSADKARVSAKECVVKSALAHVGIREATGHNDGAKVKAILASVGLSEGYAWCAATCADILNSCNIKHPFSGYCPDWFKGKNVTYPARELSKLYREDDIIKYLKSLEGNVAGYYFPGKGRIAHQGIIVKASLGQSKIVEGNTNVAGSREGDGCYLKTRDIENIYAVSIWL